MSKDQVWKTIFFFILTDQKTYFQTFRSWKTTNFFSIFFQTPQEPCRKLFTKLDKGAFI